LRKGVLMQKYYSPTNNSEDISIVKKRFYNTEERDKASKKEYLRAKKRELLWLTATVRIRTKKR
jgi:hypothetical protein